MALVGWVDAAVVVSDWADAPDDDVQLVSLLTAAHEMCVAYAPDVLPELIPDRYKLAQVLQAKHLWAREKAGNGEGFGPEGYMVQTYPLVLEARSLLRPKRSPLKGLL